MNIANRRCEEIYTSSDELLHLFRRSQHPFHIRRIRHTVLTTLYPPRLGLRGNPSRMAVRNQLSRLCQILFLLMMRHIYHDRVKGQRIRRELDERFILAVIEMHRYGNRSSRCSVCGCADDEAVGDFDLPWEDLYDKWGTFVFGGSDYADDVLDIVSRNEALEILERVSCFRASDLHDRCGHAVASCFGIAKDANGFVLAQVGLASHLAGFDKLQPLALDSMIGRIIAMMSCVGRRMLHAIKQLMRASGICNIGTRTMCCSVKKSTP